MSKDDGLENSALVPTLCTELSGQGADINRGFKGEFVIPAALPPLSKCSSLIRAFSRYVYIRPLLTDKASEAITGVRAWKQKDADGKNLDLAKGTGGDFRYVEVTRDASQAPVTGLFLLRSAKAAGVPRHFAGMTVDINEGRGGDFLYLVWRTWTRWTLDGDDGFDDAELALT